MKHNAEAHVTHTHGEAMEAALNFDKAAEVILSEVVGQRVQFYFVLRDSTVPQRLRYLLR